MNNARRFLRKYVARMLGAAPDVLIYSSPDLPFLYVNNPKCGCSTIQNSMKLAQAELFARQGRTFNQDSDPHTADDCLIRNTLAAADYHDKFLVSCVRNPFARALSAYLDKVKNGNAERFREFDGTENLSFENYLWQLASFQPEDMNSHFRPQIRNLHYPDIVFDMIFFLENFAVFEKMLNSVSKDFKINRYAAHARFALTKFKKYYSNRCKDLVLQIYRDDFDAFGYSRNLSDALDSPSDVFIHNRPDTAEDVARIIEKGGNIAVSSPVFKSTARYQRLIEMRII